jgi:IS605 OrfB family transposase
MRTLTYCKSLPTPAVELNAIGKTGLEMLLTEYASIFRAASIETVEHLQSLTGTFNKSAWNTHLQKMYGISKRHAGGVIASSEGKIDSAKECRKFHIKQLEQKLKSAKEWIRKATKKISLGRKFYCKKNWKDSKTGCNFPLSSSIDNKQTNWQRLRFAIHHKQRYADRLSRQVTCLKAAPVQVKIPCGDVFVVGSKDESFGNQICQWDGNTLRFRVPYSLESKFGKYVESDIGNFDRNINRLPIDGAKTWHFYRKDNKWVVAVQFTPAAVPLVSRGLNYGCIGIDMNPGSIGWAYVDMDGNLKAQGKIPLLMGLPTGQQDAQIVAACLQLAAVASIFSCPIVCEDLDFSAKKGQLREKGRKYARMLSGWAYSRFYQLLASILSNRGISLLKFNPAYTSLLAMVKYARMYGLSSDVAAGLTIARRGMNLSERIPPAITAYLEVNSRKHVWSALHKLNIFIKQCAVVNRRHDYYSVSNWESLAKDYFEAKARA